MTLQTQLMTPDAFDRLKEEWNALLDQSVCESVFLRWEWIHIWWEIFKQNKTLFIISTRQEGRLVGIAPFYLEPSGLLGIRYLKMCSEELSPDYMDIIAEKGHETEIAKETAKFICRQGDAWDVLSLDNLRAESVLLASPSLFVDYAHAAHVSQRCPYIRIDTSFDAYFQPRHDQFGYSVLKKWNKLREKENVTHDVLMDEEHMPKGLEDLFLMHKKRTESRAMRSNFISPQAMQFHRRVTTALLKEGLVTLQILYAGQTPVSGIYGFQYKNKVFIYQTGFDPQWSKWSVGAILWYLSIEKAFQKNVREFDFLKGTEAYKKLWSNAIRDEMQLIVFNKTGRGTLCRGIQNLKSLLRSIKQISRSASPPNVP